MKKAIHKYIYITIFMLNLVMGFFRNRGRITDQLCSLKWLMTIIIPIIIFLLEQLEYISVRNTWHLKTLYNFYLISYHSKAAELSQNLTFQWRVLYQFHQHLTQQKDTDDLTVFISYLGSFRIEATPNCRWKLGV